MNALVEDQLTRLRRSLDGPAARTWFNEHRKGNRIYFGRYNGNTPVAGHEYDDEGKPNHNKIDELVKELAQAHRASQSARKHTGLVGQQAEIAADVPYFFPCLDGGEMRCRWDMQDAPPDILITNNSMLGIMMMRETDGPIFEKTREWLQEEGSVFHLIVDELHLYRGTAGTEVAYLLRLFLQRLGLRPDSPKLRILASSASLDPKDQGSREFLEQFFGCAWTPQQIITGSPVTCQASDEDIPPLTAAPFSALAQAKDDNDQAAFAAACQNLSEQLGGNFPVEASPEEALPLALEAAENHIIARMQYACSKDGELRAVSLQTFGNNFFGGSTDAETLRSAVRGLFIARDLCPSGPSAILPSLRLHWFFRNIEGIPILSN